MSLIVVERLLKHSLDPKLLEAARPCYVARDVEHLHTYISASGDRTVCVYEAPDAASVREANEQAGLPFERVWPATRIPGS